MPRNKHRGHQDTIWAEEHYYHANGYVDRSRLSRDRRFASDLDCGRILDAEQLRGITTVNREVP